MKKVAQSLFLLFAIGGAFLAGSLRQQRTAAGKPQAGTPEVLRYACPMHPQFTSDRPGAAPCCGMRLEPVYAGEGAHTHTSSASNSPGSVSLSLEKQQMIGVRVERVDKVSATDKLRLVGRVEPDETRVYKLVAGMEGFIRQASTVTTGSRVERDQWLATFSAPDARSPVQAFLVTLGVIDRQEKSGPESPVSMRAAVASSELAIDRLLNLGMARTQIEEIRRTREIPTEFRIQAPASGFVTQRSVSHGQKFERGTEWYRIVDLSRVWIVADVFQNDAEHVRPGVRARVSAPNQRMSLEARTAEVLPQSDLSTRTLKVRLEADNPGNLLRPNMFVDVELSVSKPPALAVDSEAVLDLGLKKVVYVERGDGLFEPRQVETGWHFGNRVEIVSGLSEGERIVVSGNFLLDSESRMRLAARGGRSEREAATVKDPVCGMEVDREAAAGISRYKGKTYYLCSRQCKEQFEGNPQRYTAEPQMLSAAGWR